MTFDFIFILGFSGLLFLAPKNRTKYAYDGSNWLIRVDYPNGQIIKYAYNGAGDRVSEQIGNDVVLTSSYDAAGRLLSRGSDTFGYDADGNLIDAVEGEIPASYTWNSDNRLTMVSRVHNGCKHDKERNGYGYGHLKHGSSFVEYEKYDYLPEDWRRITRTAGVQKTAKNKTPAVEEEVFVSVYDGSDESHEYRLLTGKAASLQLEQSYISDPGTDDMNFTLSAGKILTMLKDGLGSTVSLTGNDGKVLAKIGYDAWGRFLWPTEAEDGSFDRSKDDWSDYLNRLDKTRSFGKHNAWAFGKQFADRLTPYLYTGRRFSAMTGEYWNRHRYYSPALGRFISKDPIGFEGGSNLFAYANQNPLLYTDPNGEFALTAPALIAFLATPEGAALTAATIAALWNAVNSTRKKNEQCDAPQIPFPETGNPDPDFDPDDNEGSKTNPSNPGKMNQEVARGQAPKGVERVAPPHYPGGEPHVHYTNGSSSTVSGQPGHAGRGAPQITNAIKNWLQSHGWQVPK